MRTLATGRPDPSARSGFTLVELMMTVAILAMAAGAVVMVAPDPKPPVGAEAERFAARLSSARDEAILSNRSVAVEVTEGGYDFQTFDGVRWTPLTERPFRPETWQAGSTVVGGGGTMRATFDPTGVAEPFTLTLSHDGDLRTVRVDGAGVVTLGAAS
jgi:general secretion pathway protein H